MILLVLSTMIKMMAARPMATDETRVKIIHLAVILLGFRTKKK